MRKYRCGSCGTESRHHWIEKNRVAGIRCPGCGSRNMEPVTAAGKQDATEKNAVRVRGRTPNTTTPHEKSNRRVT